MKNRNAPKKIKLNFAKDETVCMPDIDKIEKNDKATKYLATPELPNCK